MSEEFLKSYSQGWVAKDNDISAKVMQISDPELKKAQRERLWAEVNLQTYRVEADKTYQAASKEYQTKRAAFFNSHMSQWFEIAQYLDYSPNNQMVQFGNAAEAPYSIGQMILKVDIPIIDSVFSKFKAELMHDIDSTANAKWQEILSRVNPNEFYAGLPQSEIDALVAKEKKNIWDKAEQDLRQSRLMLAGQGDVIHQKLTRLAFLNQMTGSILYEFPPTAFMEVEKQLPYSLELAVGNGSSSEVVNSTKVEELFQKWVSDLQIPGTDLSDYYADNLRYYSQHDYSRENVLSDKAKLYRQYQSIRLVIRANSVRQIDSNSCEFIYDKDYTMVPRSAGPARTGTVRSHVVFKQIGGEWRIVSEWDQKG